MTTSYYPEYVPKNERHFADMLDQFRKAGTERRDTVAILWMLDPGVDRQDIVVALGRVEREIESVPISGEGGKG